MSLVSWAKKELARLKNIQSPKSKRLLLPPPPPPPPPPQTTFKTSTNYNLPSQSQISEVVLGADLKCINCQERVAAIISTININDLDSIVVHVVEKKVTLTRKPINH